MVYPALKTLYFTIIKLLNSNSKVTVVRDHVGGDNGEKLLRMPSMYHFEVFLC